VDSYAEFQDAIEAGGFFLMHWDGTAETEARVKAETKATIRCIPWDEALPTPAGPVSTREPGIDPVSGRPSAGRVIFARAY
jgi:prolyl-tRNA synthetase